MKKIISFLPRIIGYGILIVIILFALKGCVITSWSHPSEYSTYSIYGDDGREMKLIFLKDTKAIFYYKESSDFEEAVQVDLRGEYGTNYIGGLWRIEGPEIVFGFRIYPSNVKPISAEMIIEKRYISGNHESTFGKTGKATYPVFLVRGDEINFSDMWLKQEEPNMDFINNILGKIK